MTVRVLIIDDSPLARGLIGEIIAQTPGWEVAAYARDGVAAAEELKRIAPNIVTLDLEMPRMDGVRFLETILPDHPLPVVVVSSIAKAGQALTMRALALGAVDFVTKPNASTAQAFEQYATLLRAKLNAALNVNRDALRQLLARPRDSAARANVALPASPSLRPQLSGKKGALIALGASAGGPLALRRVIEDLPAHCPPVLIAQHMPAPFTAAFATRLGKDSALRVREARNGDVLEAGCGYVAPGNTHMRVICQGSVYRLVVEPGAAIRQHRPSVDVLFESVAQAAGALGVVAVLTGMGDDGARGVVAVKEVGGRAIAQDAATSAIYGMPRAAAATGVLDAILPLERIAQACIRACSG